MAETAVWPNFFLMNVFFALKGSKLFIIIYRGIHYFSIFALKHRLWILVRNASHPQSMF